MLKRGARGSRKRGTRRTNDLDEPSDWCLRRDAETGAYYYENRRTHLVRDRPPPHHILCVECERDFATRDCAKCGEAYCVDCWLSYHSKGSRKKHEYAPLEVKPWLCVQCDKNRRPKGCGKVCAECNGSRALVVR